ncbi:MAG: hypothetical protein O2854_08520 [Chloroflexi bacterium]|nr:hypothetical protein [Chloroflexota bacterium]
MSMKLNTESIARASAEHKWITIGVWVVILVVAVLLVGTLLGGALTTEANFTSNPESKRGLELLEANGLGSLEDNAAPEIIIVQSSRYTVDDPEFAAFVG